MPGESMSVSLVKLIFFCSNTNHSPVIQTMFLLRFFWYQTRHWYHQYSQLFQRSLKLPIAAAGSKLLRRPPSSYPLFSWFQLLHLKHRLLLFLKLLHLKPISLRHSFIIFAGFVIGQWTWTSNWKWAYFPFSEFRETKKKRVLSDKQDRQAHVARCVT